MRPGRRVLVATDHRRCPTTTLQHAAALAGPHGEVVLASVVVVPLSQSLEARVDRAVTQACEVLEEGDRGAGGTAFDTRLVRARSFAEGVLGTLAEERFDLLVLERGPGTPRAEAAAQTEALMQRATATVVLIRAARPAAG